MIVQHVRAVNPAGAYQRPQPTHSQQMVVMGTPAPTMHPKVEPAVTPRVSHTFEASLSKLNPSGG